MIQKKGKLKNENERELELYFNDIKDSKPLTRQQEKEFAERIKDGDEEAVMKLVNANLKFVVKIASNYKNCGVSMSDIISEGNIGLITAARKFDPSKNVKFITYAVWWIRNSIQECLQRCKSRESNTLDYVFDNETEDAYSNECDSVNEKFESDMSVIQDKVNCIDEMLGCLQEREVKILTLYYGLYNNKEFTLDEIGDEMNITTERVRQIKDKALVKLKVIALSSDEFEIFKELR